jgi:RimJ/RimL family protein N-acetyltransferase
MYIVMDDAYPAGTMGVILGEETEIQRVLLGEKKLARTGVMSEALQMLIEVYGPDRRYRLRVKPDNIPAIRFYEKNGFSASYKDGGYLVMTRYAA